MADSNDDDHLKERYGNKRTAGFHSAVIFRVVYAGEKLK